MSSMPSAVPSLGVVCRAQGDVEGRAQNYLVARDRRATWHAQGGERRRELAACRGTLMAVCEGMASTSRAAQTAAEAVARVLSRLVVGADTQHIEVAGIVQFLMKAHSRMAGKLREAGQVDASVEFALAWVVDRRLFWVEMGRSQAAVLRDGVLRPLGRDDLRAQGFLRGGEAQSEQGLLRFQEGVNLGWTWLQPGDKVLLASQALWEACSPAAVAELMMALASPQAAAVAVRERALARGAKGPVSTIIWGPAVEGAAI